MRLRAVSDTATNGTVQRQALRLIEFLKKEQPTILLTDYTLPGITGLEFFKLIKPLYPELKVAILSMHDEESLVRMALKEGIQDEQAFRARVVKDLKLDDLAHLVGKSKILQGLCTMGIACRALLHACCGDRPERCRLRRARGSTSLRIRRPKMR